MVLVLLAACGVNTQQQGSTGGTTAESPAAAGSPQAGGEAASPGAASPSASAGASQAAGGSGTTIRWRTRPSDAAEQGVYQELADSATQALADQGITVQYDPGVNQGYFEKLKTELASGNAPDIFWIGSVELADFVNTGKVLDIKPFIDGDSEFNIEDFNQLTIEQLTRDGKIYGLPRDVSTMVVYYNEDLFREAGLPTPRELSEQGNWNWDTFQESAQTLTDPSKQQYGVGWGNWWGPAWGWFVNAAGGSLFNEDRTACALNTPEAIAGAQFARDFYEQNQRPLGDDAEVENLFNTGKVGMLWSGRWTTPGVRQNAQFNWDVAEMPQGEAESTWLFWGPYLINADTANPEAAWEVLKQITSAEAMAKVAELGTNIPARTNQEAVDAFLNSTPPENNQAFIAGTEYAVAEAPVWEGNWADFSAEVQSLWDQMIAGQITPEQWGQQACEQTAATFN
jgi:multiple sugar transport system substrate-binding protein